MFEEVSGPGRVPLRHYAAVAGVISAGLSDSGRKGTKDRKQFAALFEDAHKRKFDCVLFWALDRFTREGMVPTIQHLQRLAGPRFHDNLSIKKNPCLDGDLDHRFWLLSHSATPDAWITPGADLRQRRDSDAHRTIGFGDHAQSLGVEFDVR